MERGHRGIRGGVVLFLIAISHMGCGGGGEDDAESQAGGSSALGSLVTGLQLLKGKFELFGITTDDVVAALDSKRGALAVPVNGDAVQQIDATSDQVAVAGPVIYSFHGVDPTSTFGDLTIWTSAHGAVPFASGATWPVAVSDDGDARAGDRPDQSATGRRRTWCVGGTDGTSPTSCFRSGSARVARRRSSSPRAGSSWRRVRPASPKPSVSSIDPSDGTMIPLLARAQSQITRIPAAAAVALLDTAGTAYLADVAGGHPR